MKAYNILLIGGAKKTKKTGFITEWTLSYIAEVNTLGATSGTFKLDFSTFGSTAEMTYNISPANMQTAVRLLVGLENTLVTRTGFGTVIAPYIYKIETGVYDCDLPTLLDNTLDTTPTISLHANSLKVTLPLYNSGVFNCIVNWGDGTPNSTITAYNDADRIHTYASNGIYQVEITGECPAWSFNNTGDKLKITDIINWGDTSNFGGFAYLSGGFYGCRNLKSLGKGKIITKEGLTSLQSTFREAGWNKVGFTIPDGLLDNCVDVTNMSYLFTNCTSLTSIPTDLFKYNTGVTTNGFLQTFYGCTSLTSIPTDLFKYNTGVTSSAFRETFFDCSSLTSIPTDLFRYNTNVSTFGFYKTFFSCNKLTSIPTDLFKYNTEVTSNAFQETFFDCSSLTSIPTDLFRYNTNVSTNGFFQTFYGCSSLTSIPTDLFRYNTNVSTKGFYQTFYGCTKLQLNAEIFYALGEEATRFLNQSPNFTDCFSRDSFTGTQGTAPALWDCNFGTGTPTTTGCFGDAGNSLTSLTNYGDIPAGYK